MIEREFITATIDLMGILLNAVVLAGLQLIWLFVKSFFKH